LKTGFAGRIDNPTFSISTAKKSNFNLLRIEEELSAAHLRLSRVYIENLPYERVITRFDRPHTFFYVDPPYFGCEDYYGKGIFSKDDFAKLSNILAGISGKFIMSINDVEDIRELFRDFHIEEVTTTYTCAGKKKKAKELLIMNHEP
jgi:DNA adenine methylase